MNNCLTLFSNVQVEYLPVITPHENRKESAVRLAQRVSLVCSRIYSSAIWTRLYFLCVMCVVAYQNFLDENICRIHVCFQLLLINVPVFSIIEILPGKLLHISLSLVWSSLLFLSFHTVGTKNVVALFLRSWVWHSYEYFISYSSNTLELATAYTRIRYYILVNKSI